MLVSQSIRAVILNFGFDVQVGEITNLNVVPEMMERMSQGLFSFRDMYQQFEQVKSLGLYLSMTVPKSRCHIHTHILSCCLATVNSQDRSTE